MPASRERVSAGRSAAFVDDAQSTGSRLEEFDQLRRRRTEQTSRILGIVVASGQDVESFSQHCRKVIMVRVYIESTTATASTPDADSGNTVGRHHDESGGERSAPARAGADALPPGDFPPEFAVQRPGQSFRSGDASRPRPFRPYCGFVPLVPTAAWRKITLTGQPIGVERSGMID